MKTLRLIVGIISIVLVLVIIFQSCAAGVGNVLSGGAETSGFAGFIFSICFLIAGIVGVVTREEKGGGGAITSIVFYVIGGLIGISNYGSFADLQIWSILSFIFASLYLLSIIFDPRKRKEKVDSKLQATQLAEPIDKNKSVNMNEDSLKAMLQKIPKVVIFIIIIAFILLVFFLSYVIIGGKSEPLKAEDPNAIYTQAVEAVFAGMTQTAAVDPNAIYTQVAGTIMAEANQTTDMPTPKPPEDTIPTAVTIGTRTNPVPLGQSLDLIYQNTANFQLKILEVHRGQEAWNMISQANMFNDAPPDGMEYILAKVSVIYLTSKQQDYTLSIDSFYFRSVSNNQILDTPSVVEPEPELNVNLFPGGNGEGYITVLAYTDDPAPLIVYEDWVSFDSTPFYFSIGN